MLFKKPGKRLGLRKKAEESLQSSEAIRKRVFESSQIPIVVIDPASSKYIDCNQAAIEIYGFSSRDEIVGKTPEHFSAPYNTTERLLMIRRDIILTKHWQKVRLYLNGNMSASMENAGMQRFIW